MAPTLKAVGGHTFFCNFRDFWFVITSAFPFVSVSASLPHRLALEWRQHCYVDTMYHLSQAEYGQPLTSPVELIGIGNHVPRATGHSNLFFNSTGGLLGHKRSLFEGGVRSPTMVRHHVVSMWSILQVVCAAT
jgi:hypothetical protein